LTESAYTDSLNELIKQFGKLPGIGSKTAERLAMHILNCKNDEAIALAGAISNVKSRTGRCKTCYNLAESDTCNICADTKRDSSIICIVEQPKDLISLEKTGQCNWLYHVLGGRIAPLEGIEPDDLTINALIKRLQTGQVREIVMATNPNIEGDGTALYISSLIRPMGISITRLGRGLPTGSSIEYASGSSLSDAINLRQQLP
jgi:recombination protein RecR